MFLWNRLKLRQWRRNKMTLRNALKSLSNITPRSRFYSSYWVWISTLYSISQPEDRQIYSLSPYLEKTMCTSLVRETL